MLIDAPKLSVNQVARKLNRHVCTIWRWAQRGVSGRKLPLLRVGGRAYVLVDELEKFLAAGQDVDTQQHAATTDLECRAKIAGEELAKFGIK